MNGIISLCSRTCIIPPPPPPPSLKSKPRCHATGDILRDGLPDERRREEAISWCSGGQGVFRFGFCCRISRLRLVIVINLMIFSVIFPRRRFWTFRVVEITPRRQISGVLFSSANHGLSSRPHAVCTRTSTKTSR